MPKVETNLRRIMDRLAAEGWVVEGGTNHTKLSNPKHPRTFITVPRHRTLAPGTARSIAKAAGWI